MRSVLNAAAAVVVSVALLGVLGFGYGTIPALGPALDPGRGAWTSASGGQPAGSRPGPMVPLALFRSPTFAGTNLLTLLLYGALGGGLFFLPFDLIQVHGYSAASAGASLLPLVVLVATMSR